MEQILQNLEMIIVAVALVANFIINLSKKDFKWGISKVNNIEKQVILNRRDSLRALIYSKAPVLNRMYGLLEYIKLGFNHNTIDWAVKDFILDNKELWWATVNETKDDPIVDKENYNDCMIRIKQLLH